MFSLKSASMASFLSSSFSLFLLCQPSYNMNMSSDTSKLLFTEAFALCNSSNDDLFPALDTCLLALILGPASSPAPDCRSDPLSPCLSVCTSVCPPILFVCLSVGARRKWLRFWVQSEYESRCVHQYTQTLLVSSTDTAGIAWTQRCWVEPEQQTAHQLTLVSVCVLSKNKQTCEIKGTPAMEKKRVKNQSDLDFCFSALIS